jgi:Family of unknown function (DUF5946)
MTTISPLEPCPGCGRLYPAVQDPAHAYIGASPGCWARYGELLALEFGDAGLMRWHRLTADAYAAQHPGVPERRAAQSVHVHLAGLYSTLERGLDGQTVSRAMQRLADGRVHAWLDPPPLATAIGVAELIEAAGDPSYGERVRAWAEAVWRAWTPHHDAIRTEAEAALTSH